MRYSIPIFCLGLIISCTNTTDETNEINLSNSDTSHVSIDTIGTEILVQEETVLIEKGINEFSLPFSLDSLKISEIEEVEEADLLSGSDVKGLMALLVANELNEGCRYDVNSFIIIDSLKANDGYEAYGANIDIGMILYAESYAHYRLKLDENRFHNDVVYLCRKL